MINIHTDIFLVTIKNKTHIKTGLGRVGKGNMPCPLQNNIQNAHNFKVRVLLH